jgi:hypothetical protein
MGKATFRLPDSLLEELRHRSLEEGRSLNTVAVEVLWRGLGKEPVPSSLVEMFGPLIAQPATRRYNDAEARQLLAGISEDARHLSDALDQAREDRCL